MSFEPIPASPVSAAPISSPIPADADPADAHLVREPSRLVCAAVQLHPALRNAVLDALLRDRHRAIAESPDVDVARVLDRAARAHVGDVWRDGLLAGVLLTFGVIWLEAFGGLLDPERLLSRHPSLALWAGYLVAYAIVLGHTLLRRARVRREFADGRAAGVAASSADSSAVASRAATNLVVYSGFQPFVGAGYALSAWSFAISTDRKTEGLGARSPSAFTADELESAIAAALRATNLGGLALQEQYFVQGQDIARLGARFMPDPLEGPAASIDPSIADPLLAAPDARIRRYLRARVRSWNGEVILSLYLRCRLAGNSLFVEASYWILPPVAEAHHEVDRLRLLRMLLQQRLLARVALATAGLLVAAVPATLANLAAPLVAGFRRWFVRRSVRADPLLDHGAATSVRQLAAADEYRRYFEKMDGEMHLEVLERQVLDAIVAFLDARGVDTSDLRERRTSILNTGVMVTGGTVTAGAVSAGPGARSTSQGRPGVLRRAARAARRAATVEA